MACSRFRTTQGLLSYSVKQPNVLTSFSEVFTPNNVTHLQQQMPNKKETHNF